MKQPIWEQKRDRRDAFVRELIAQLDSNGSDYALQVAGALDYYALKRTGMPHKDRVKIRKELIEIAQNYLRSQE